MSVISIGALLSFFEGEEKLIARGENAMKSNHIVSFLFDDRTGMMTGDVQASMRNKSYKVEVSGRGRYLFVAAYLYFAVC